MVKGTIPLSIWVQVANGFFLLASLFSDILVIRTCLFLAYFFLTLNAILGGPLWPDIYNSGFFQTDAFVWGVVNLYVLVSGLVRLWLDECPVELTEDEDALWRMMYRLAGISRKVFLWDVARRMEVVHYKKGDELPVKEYFHLVYKGTVELEVLGHDGTPLTKEKNGSGAMFDFKKLGLVYDLQEMTHHSIRVTVHSEEATLYQFANDKIADIAKQQSLKGVWHTMFLGHLARIANNHYNKIDGFTYIQDDFIDPIFAPLKAHEQPDPLIAGSGKALMRPISHLIRYVRTRFSPPWPIGYHLIGLRHHDLPAPPRSLSTVPPEMNVVVMSQVSGVPAGLNNQLTDDKRAK